MMTFQDYPVPLTSDDAKRGIISLVERGIIPQGAHITLEPPPILPKKSNLNNPSMRTKPFVKGRVVFIRVHFEMRIFNDKFVSLALDESNTFAYHLDPSTGQQLALLNKRLTSPTRSDPLSSGTLTEPSEVDLRIVPINHKSQQFNMMESRKSSANPIQKQSQTTTYTRTDSRRLKNCVDRSLPTPASAIEYKKAFRLIIQNGLTKDQTDDFIQFRQCFCLTWGSIVTVIRMLEKLMHEYGVSIAFINGEK
jgi:IQ domain-containing protein H